MTLGVERSVECSAIATACTEAADGLSTADFSERILMRERAKLRYRFGLRGLLILMAFTAACIAFITHHRRLEQKRFECYARMDDTVTWDIYSDRPEESELPWTRWLTMKLSGGSLEFACIYVEFRPGSKLRDVQEFVSLFPEIQRVGLYAETATEDRIALLHQMPMLETVIIIGPMVSDEAMRHIRDLPQPITLELYKANLDQDTVDKLRRSGLTLSLPSKWDKKAFNQSRR